MKTALITGIGRGIGKALAQKFLAEGYAVIGTTQAGTADYAHDGLTVVQLDLADPASIEKCAIALAASGAKPDVFIDNAGVLLDSGETHLRPDLLRQTLDVNVIGTADLTERVIPLMSSSGHVVVVSSEAGSISDMDDVSTSHSPYHYPAYKISKAALNMYVRTLAIRLHHDGAGIIVSAVHPGWVRTDMGGTSATLMPEEAAADVFKLAVSRPPTGRFWYKGKEALW